MTSVGSLNAKLQILSQVVELGSGRMSEQALESAQKIIKGVKERASSCTELTVVALAGPTGVGKSNLFNVLTATELAEVAVRRPTTYEAHAAYWDEKANVLLDWLQIPQRHLVAENAEYFAPLVLIDLPDYDSVELRNRRTVDQLVTVVDAIIWVVDPEKYADVMLHDEYLRSLAAYTEVMMVAFNKADNLSDENISRCVRDMRVLLDDNNLKRTPIVATSAATGAGIPALREMLRRVVKAKVAMTRHIASDISTAGKALETDLGEGSNVTLNRRALNELHIAMQDAASLPQLVQSLEDEVLRRGYSTVGWPFVSRRFKKSADSLKKLAQRTDIDVESESPSALAGAVQQAKVEQCLRSFTGSVLSDLPAGWARSVQETAKAHSKELRDGLGQIALTPETPPADVGWWRIFQGIQVASFVTALAGLIWIVIGFVMPLIGQPLLPNIAWLGYPAPAWILAIGVLAGLGFGFLGKALVRPRARQVADLANKALQEKVAELTQRHVVEPVQEELERYLTTVRTIRTLE